MQYREFARTGWTVSELGFGARQIGGEWSDMDDAHSIQTLLHAFEKGNNFVDTAELYGKSRSVEVIGRDLPRATRWFGAEGKRQAGRQAMVAFVVATVRKSLP